MDKIHYIKDKNNITKQVEDLDAVKKSISLTYAALKALRDGSNLVPGQWYRITDYVTTTVQADTQSAGHQFDILVFAGSPSELNEQAYAIQHDGDTYFANAKLQAWQLKYCLDNDYSRFAWAVRNSITISSVEYVRSESDDVEGAAYPYCWVSGTTKRYTASETPSTGSGQARSSSTGGTSYTVSSVMTDDGSGKGVIYWMKDEFGNECGYDFKNIRFKRYKVTAMVSNTTLQGLYVGYREVNANNSQGSLYPSGGTVSTSDTAWRYTFDFSGADYSLTPRQYGCHGNIIAPLKLQDTTSNRERQWLNNITFCNTQASAACWGNKFEERCHSMSFGNSCYANKFGQSCWYNTFGQDCCRNTFGQYCFGNTFGQGCQYNTFGQYCVSNTFGQYCVSNTFGQSCWYNTFGQNCYYNTFGQSCCENTFGQSCQYNTFGQSCSDDTFGQNCRYNTFGQYCFGNTFGQECYGNTFGQDCGYNTFGQNCRFNSVDHAYPMDGDYGTNSVPANTTLCKLISYKFDYIEDEEYGVSAWLCSPFDVTVQLTMYVEDSEGDTVTSYSQQVALKAGVPQYFETKGSSENAPSVFHADMSYSVAGQTIAFDGDYEW